MKNRILSLLMAGIFFTAPSLLWAQNSGALDEIKTASGTVVSKDWVADKIIINTGDDELTIIVPNGTKVTKGTHDSSLSEININDYVAIEYGNKNFAGLIATRITVRSTEH